MIVHGRSLAGEDVGRKPVGARKLHSGIVSKGATNSRIAVGRSDEARVGSQKTAVTVQLRFQSSEGETGGPVDREDALVARGVKSPHVGGAPPSPVGCKSAGGAGAPRHGRARAPVERRLDGGLTRRGQIAGSSTVGRGWAVKCRRVGCGGNSTVGGWRSGDRTRGS